MDFDIKINGTGRKWKGVNWKQMAQNKFKGPDPLRGARNLCGPCKAKDLPGLSFSQSCCYSIQPYGL